MHVTSKSGGHQAANLACLWNLVPPFIFCTLGNICITRSLAHRILARRPSQTTMTAGSTRPSQAFLLFSVDKTTEIPGLFKQLGPLSTVTSPQKEQPIMILTRGHYYVARSPMSELGAGLGLVCLLSSKTTLIEGGKRDDWSMYFRNFLNSVFILKILIIGYCISLLSLI